jgi:hypothetical protein
MGKPQTNNQEEAGTTPASPPASETPNTDALTEQLQAGQEPAVDENETADGGPAPDDTPDSPTVDPAEVDTTSATVTPIFVNVRLGKDSPVGRLVVGDVAIERNLVGQLPAGEFERLKDEYHLEEVTD